MEWDEQALFVHEFLTRAGHRWKINGVKIEPSIEDVEELIKKMRKDLESSDYDSIESGGILIKRDRDKLDVYVHLGELREDSNT